MSTSYPRSAVDHCAYLLRKRSRRKWLVGNRGRIAIDTFTTQNAFGKAARIERHVSRPRVR